MSDAGYQSTRDRVEHYFDRTATRTWEALTSEAPVSGIRATVRAGRDRMRQVLLEALPEDLSGARILDAGCGTGAMAVELARRGAEVVAIDISPALVAIARRRCPEDLLSRIDFRSGDMSQPGGRFDHAVAMDSLIYYEAPQIAALLGRFDVSESIVFTVAPRGPLLVAMFRIGKLFPRGNRSPVMVPHAPSRIRAALRAQNASGRLVELTRVTSGFYISTALEYRP